MRIKVSIRDVWNVVLLSLLSAVAIFEWRAGDQWERFVWRMFRARRRHVARMLCAVERRLFAVENLAVRHGMAAEFDESMQNVRERREQYLDWDRDSTLSTGLEKLT